MKPLITAAEVKKAARNKDKAIYIESGGIVTPAARDAAREYGIKIFTTTEEQPALDDRQGKNVLNQAIIASIVGEIISSLNINGKSCSLQKKGHQSGVKLVRGYSVCLEDFLTDSNGKVQLKEIFSIKESPSMIAGLMTIDKTPFSYDFKYDEISYVLEGTLDCIINGETITAMAGDVLFIPANTRLTLSAVDKVKLFFVTHPGNWNVL